MFQRADTSLFSFWQKQLYKNTERKWDENGLPNHKRNTVNTRHELKVHVLNSALSTYRSSALSFSKPVQKDDHLGCFFHRDSHGEEIRSKTGSSRPCSTLRQNERKIPSCLVVGRYQANGLEICIFFSCMPDSETREEGLWYFRSSLTMPIWRCAN